MSLTNAEKCKAYRQRLKEQGKAINTLHRLEEWREREPAKYAETRRASNRKQSVRNALARPFVAIDGEGTDTKNFIVIGEKKDKPRKLYDHIYTLLADSNGRKISDWKFGLRTHVIFEWLLGLPQNAFCVGYGLSYDVNKWLTDLSPEALVELHREKRVYWQGYLITYLPRKVFSITKVDSQNDSRQTRTIYDVIGFFQTSFIKALTKNGIAVPAIITEQKAQRGNFTEANYRTIEKYNLLECKLLVELMDKLRDNLYAAGVLPSKWHGAGAVATTVLQQHKVKEHNQTPPKMLPLFLQAYYGGRNQMVRQGTFSSLWAHDINSAYPAAMIQLPSAIGKWKRIPETMLDSFLLSQYNPWTLCKVEWDITDKRALIMPFPFRHKGRIYWPRQGRGYYWLPEVLQAKHYYAPYLRIIEAYQFEPATSTKPFAFVEQLYRKRQEYVATGNPAEQGLKLSYNAIYGKLAQSISSKDTDPPYQNYFWAGYITSYTRAQVFELAMQSPESIVFFATDGVMSEKQLAQHSPTKELGYWDVKQVKDFIGIQSGVYSYEGATRTRGFSAASLDYAALRKEWKKNGPYGELEYLETRFITLGKAIQANDDIWGKWDIQPRKLSFLSNGVYEEMPGKGPYTNVRVYDFPLNVKDSEGYKKKNFEEKDFEEDTEDDL